MPALKFGNTGPRVERLQRRLRATGYQLAIDGTFSATTDAVVRAFQREHGLVADGVYGPRTEAALRLHAPLLLGVDVSSHQDARSLDLRTLARRDPIGLPRARPEAEQGIRFIAIRATIGEGGEDLEWRDFLRRALDAGVPYVIFYHLLKAWQSVERQAERLAEALTEAAEIARGCGGVVAPAVDVEWPPERDRQSQQIELAGPATLAFLTRVSALTSQRGIVYTAPAFVRASPLPWPPELAAYPLWLAHFNGPGKPISARLPLDLAPPDPWTRATFGQFDGDGGVMAPDGQDIDSNWYEGSREDFEREIVSPFCDEDTTP